MGWPGMNCRACKLGLLASWTRPATRPVLLPSAPAPVGDILGHVLWPDRELKATAEEPSQVTEIG